MTDERTITISEGGFELPLAGIMRGRGAIFGKSGSGKSNSLGVVVEEILDYGYPVLIVDADGEHRGLKEDYEILHVGGESADVPVGPEHADALAGLMLEENVPVVLDVSEFLHDEAAEMIVAVAQSLFRLEQSVRQPFPIFIEEAQEYIPQQGGSDDVAEELIRIAKRGRKRGLGVVAVSQRPASVDKDFITQCDWIVWHRLTWQNDTAVVKDEIGADAMESVQNLGPGEAIVQADEFLDDIHTVQFRRKTTYDYGEAPGFDDEQEPELKSVDESVIETLRSITEEEEEREDELESLRQTVSRLRDEKAELQQRLDDATTSGETTDEDVERLRERIGELKDERDSLQERLDDVEDDLAAVESERDEFEARVQELETRVQDIEEAGDHLYRALGILGLEEPQEIETDADVEAIAEERDRLRERVEDLKRRLGSAREAGGEVLPDDADYIDFVDRDAVRNAIEEAKDDDSTSPKYVEDVVMGVIQEGGWADYDTLAEYAGISSTHHIGQAANALETVGVVRKQKMDGRTHVDLNVDGIEEIIKQQKKRERTNELREDMFS